MKLVLGPLSSEERIQPSERGTWQLVLVSATEVGAIRLFLCWTHSELDSVAVTGKEGRSG